MSSRFLSLSQRSSASRTGPWLCALAVATLTACGGGSDDTTTPSSATEAATVGPLVFDLPAADAALAAETAGIQAQPTFHAAPVILDEPDDTDVADPGASALRAPHAQRVSAALAGLSTQRLSLDRLLAAQRSQALAAPAGEVNAALAATSTVQTYTPAQIRAAYAMPALPGAGSAPTPAQAAALGAGQTIYIINAHHSPNAAAELAAFNLKFGLPACAAKAVAANSVLPLASASATGCEFAQVYATASGTLTTAVPTYDAGWATEIALDVQWVHATAPLARVVLIEAVDASLNSLLGAVKLANAMGPGVVSMSFGATEGNYTASVDAAFTAARMTYLAATGDAGVAVSWPSVSTNVVAVGGTTLSYGGGMRSESAWAGTGGGVSAYTATPAYQNPAVPGFTGYARRAVADVAFNADPNSGQYVAVMPPGTSAAKWMSVGGTSLATPQWAGLMAMANAQRGLAARLPLGGPHALLYGQIGAVPGSYASAFLDVAQGRHGTCSLCTAKAGYDELTGLGTPNVGSLLNLLSGSAPSAAAPVPPVVAGATISGQPGVALSAAVGVTAPNTVSYTLAGAPSGMAISSGGVISWASPVAGSYAVTVTARDTKTALSGQGLLTFNIVKSGPVVSYSPMAGVAGKALTGSFSIADATTGAMSIAISGVPSGMAFSGSGLTFTAKWASPVTGTYTLKVAVMDAAGLSTTANIPVTITAK